MHKNNHYVESPKSYDFDKYLYRNAPNLRFKENIVNNFNSCYWICDTFDVYYPSKEVKELHLIYSIFDKKEITIFRISDKKIIKSLSGHSNFIDKVKNFYNDKDNHNYLLSADWDYYLLVWDLDNNYEIRHKINTKYSNYLYSFLIYFKLDYIITSSYGQNELIDFIKIYSFKDGKFLRNVPQTDTNNTLQCLIWEKGKEELYIIALCYEKISIFNLLNNELYGHLTIPINQSCGDYYFSGFISYDNKYLYTSSSEGFINIWNLLEKSLVKNIAIPNGSLFKIVPWSIYINYSYNKEDSKLYKIINNYILVCDKMKFGILSLNIMFRNEIDYNNFTNKIDDLGEEFFHEYQVLNLNKKKQNEPIKKIQHPLYGDSILCSDENRNIDLWINNEPIIVDIFENQK